MSVSKEARIGMLVTAAIVIFFAGFYYLKGSNIFSSENTYTCYYSDVQGLQPSANIQVRGLNIGRVSKIELVGNKGVKVTLSVNKSVEVTKGTVASLTSSDLLGTKIIRLDLANSGVKEENGDTLASNVEGGIMDNVSSQITPLLKDVRGVVSALDTVLVGVQGIVDDQNQRSISNTLASLDKTTANFSNLSESLNRETGEINSIIHNANAITGNLAADKDKINTILDNASATTEQLKNAPIQQTVTELQAAASQLKDVMTKINNNEGSAGMLVNDKQLYNNLSGTLASLQKLLADINEHPSRYINVTIFGKKKP